MAWRGTPGKTGHPTIPIPHGMVYCLPGDKPSILRFRRLSGRDHEGGRYFHTSPFRLENLGQFGQEQAVRESKTLEFRKVLEARMLRAQLFVGFAVLMGMLTRSFPVC